MDANGGSLRPSELWFVAGLGGVTDRRSGTSEPKEVGDDLRRRSSPPDRATLLKQYELIRAEVTTSLQLQQQILGFGIATIGLLAGAAFVSRSGPFRSQLLVVFLPLICYFALTIWFSEVMRMLRAGAFLVTVEKRLDACGDGSLEWESRLAADRLKRSRKRAVFVQDPDRLRLAGVTALFFSLAGEAIMLGWDDASSFARTFSVAAGLVAAIVLRRLFRLRLGEWNDLLEVDESSRGVALEKRALVGSRKAVAAARTGAVHVRRRSSPERRFRRTPTPVLASRA
jgi:hypothetical protein